jgi:hypothetical protein
MDIVGLKEIAKRLSAPIATVQQWRRRAVLPEPEGWVSGQPAWRWATIVRWVEQTGRTPELRYRILTVLRERGGMTTSGVTSALVARRWASPHATTTTWRVLNDLTDEGLVSIGRRNVWSLTPRGEAEMVPTHQRVVGGNEPPPLVEAIVIPSREEQERGHAR